MFDLHREYFTAINRQSPPLSLTKPRGRAARRVTARGVGTDQPEEAVANKARGCVGGGREAGHLRLRVSRAAREGSAAASAAPPSGPMLFQLRRNGEVVAVSEGTVVMAHGSHGASPIRVTRIVARKARW